MLEVERYFACQGARGYVVRAAEGGEEVVKRVLVGDVHSSQVEVDLVVIRPEDVAFAGRDVEEVTRCDARRVMVVVAGARSGDAKESGTEFSSGTDCRQRIAEGGALSIAHESSLELLKGPN